MQSRHLLQVFLRHTFHTCIRRVCGQGHIGLFEPVVQGLGMNTQQTSTVCDRKNGHTQNSFQGKIRWETTRAQISRNSGTSRKFLGSLGNERAPEQSREGGVSQLGLAS